MRSKGKAPEQRSDTPAGSVSVEGQSPTARAYQRWSGPRWRVVVGSEDELFARYHDDGDRDARTALCERFLPLARSLARRYERPNESLDDLVQVASEGLVKAVDRFDPGRGSSFAAYAAPTILGELKRHFRDRSWSARVPRRMQERALAVGRATQELTGTLGRSPSTAEVAAAIGGTSEQVHEAREAAIAHIADSLDTSPGDPEDGGYAERVGAPDPNYDRVEDAATLAHGLESLGSRDRLIVRLRFQDDLTQGEIAARIGVSQMQVSRLLHRALERLRSDTAAA